jgi:hypothetical protein
MPQSDYRQPQQAGSSPAASAQAGAGGQGDQTTAEALLEQATEAVQNVAGSASEMAQKAMDEGRRYAQATRERYPEAERYMREGSQVVRQQAAEHPLLAVLVGFGIGYALAYMIHAGGSTTDRVPDYAKRRSSYVPQPPA